MDSTLLHDPSLEFTDDFFLGGLIFNRSRYPWKALSMSVAGHAVAIYVLVSYSSFLANLPPAEQPPNLAKARIIEMELPRLRPFLPPKPKEQTRRGRARAKTPVVEQAPPRDAAPLQAPVPVRKEARRFEGPSLRLTPEPRPVPEPTLIQMETPLLTPQTQLDVPSILVLSNRTVKLPPRTFVRPPERPQIEPPKAVVLEAAAPRIDTSIGTLPVPRSLSEHPVLPVFPAVQAPATGEALKVAETSTARNPKGDENVTLIAQPEFRTPPAATVSVPATSQLGGSVNQPVQVSAPSASATAGGTGVETASRVEGRSAATSRAEVDSSGSQPASPVRSVASGTPGPIAAPGGDGQGSHPGIASAEKIVLPRDGKYDVVITQNSGIVASTASFLSGRPVYSVYVRVGQRTDWILQYCFPVDRDNRRSNSVVVQLSKIPPVAGPYAFLLLRPAITFKQAAHYAFIHGVINTSGRFEKLQEVGGHVIENVDDVLDALTAWEFRPATKDGQPTAVEVLLCIPNPLG